VKIQSYRSIMWYTYSLQIPSSLLWKPQMWHKQIFNCPKNCLLLWSLKVHNHHHKDCPEPIHSLTLYIPNDTFLLYFSIYILVFLNYFLQYDNCLTGKPWSSSKVAAIIDWSYPKIIILGVHLSLSMLVSMCSTFLWQYIISIVQYSWMVSFSYSKMADQIYFIDLLKHK
jgi:hypothetical protein